MIVGDQNHVISPEILKHGRPINVNDCKWTDGEYKDPVWTEKGYEVGGVEKHLVKNKRG